MDISLVWEIVCKTELFSKNYSLPILKMDSICDEVNEWN